MTFKFFTGIEEPMDYTEPFPPPDDCYSTGWNAAQHGFPESSNPWFINSNEYAMWYCGWNDFVNNH